jgi:hypothetical protein
MSYVINNSGAPSGVFGEEAEILLTIEVLPLNVSSNYQEIYPKLTVDGTEVAIRAGTIRTSRDGAGRDGSFTLWDVADRTVIQNAVTNDLTVQFDYTNRAGTVLSNRFTNGIISGSSFGIGGDTFSFSVISGESDKLNMTPTSALVIYDPDRAPFDSSELEPDIDSSGTEYPIEEIQVTDLLLSDLFDEIFVTRLGFASWQSNIPADDYPIRRYTCEMGVPFIDDLAGHIGMYRPQYIQRPGNILEINGTALLQASGFPTPIDLTYERCTDIVVNKAETQAVFAELLFSESDAYDLFTYRARIYDTDNGGDSGAGTLVTVRHFETYTQFRYTYAPSIIQSEQLTQDKRITYNGTILGTQTREDNLINTYDKFGRLLRTTNTVGELVPDLDNEGAFIWQDSVDINIVETAYAQHPRNLRRQYQKSITRREAGLQIIDTDSPYAWNSTASQFNQSYREAHRAGNIRTGMAYLGSQPIKTVTETFRPDRNGQVYYSREGFDHVQNQQLFHQTDPRVGDISLNGGQSRPRKIIVFENEGETITQGRKVSVPVGELPLKYGVELARADLKRLKTINRTSNLTIIGIDLRLDRGTVFIAKDKDGITLGTFNTLETTESFSASNEGNSFSMEVQAEQI